MFPSLLLRGIDLALDFATLGEYGLEPLPAPASPAPAFRVDLSGIGGEPSPADSEKRLSPATPAARRLEAARQAAARPPKPELGAPLPSRSRIRTSTFGAPHRTGAPRPRKRAGAAAPRPQPCLVAAGRRER
jgi:hypothetical protein